MPTGGESKRAHSCITCGKKVRDGKGATQTPQGWSLLCPSHAKPHAGYGWRVERERRNAHRREHGLPPLDEAGLPIKETV